MALKGQEIQETSPEDGTPKSWCTAQRYPINTHSSNYSNVQSSYAFNDNHIQLASGQCQKNMLRIINVNFFFLRAPICKRFRDKKTLSENLLSLSRISLS